MEQGEFEALLGRVAGLTVPQREILQRLLAVRSPVDAVRELLDGKAAGQRCCAHCRSERVAAWGSAHGLKRYRCSDCRRTFNALTGTPLARLRHKSAWLSFAAALQEAQSVRKSATACGVATSTAFRWRHRFLIAPTADKPAQMSGIVEADETFFRRSFKGSRQWTKPQADEPPPRRPARKRGAPTGKRGTPLDQQVPVLIVRDRQRTTSDAILPNLTARAIGAELAPLLGRDALLCTDTGRAYGVIARYAGIRHEPLNIAAGERVRDRVFHIQNVNAYDSRLKQWMCRFNGVATRYLHHYLGWRRLLERLPTTSNPHQIILQCV
ncbi:MAG: IS1595 family transposase [Rhodanobacteraceae bacterium]